MLGAVVDAAPGSLVGDVCYQIMVALARLDERRNFQGDERGIT